MSDDYLSKMPEPMRIELAKADLKTYMGTLQYELGLSEMQAVTVMECVLGEQRAYLGELLSQQAAAYVNTLHDTMAELEKTKAELEEAGKPAEKTEE